MTPRIEREEWHDLARKLDWELTYVTEEEAFPAEQSGAPWLPASAWADWDEPFRTTFTEYVTTQSAKESGLAAVREAVGRSSDLAQLPPTWVSGLLLHFATLPLAEFSAVIGNLRAARFGRHSAWRSTAALGALDELRHTQIPLAQGHELVRDAPRFDWTHKFYHSNNWVAIAARHFADELLVGSSAIDMAIGTNFVFETGFTNLQFVALSALARDVGDHAFESILTSIQSDEARHAQIGGPVLAVVAKHDRAHAQYLLDKWFWRSWQMFAVVTGFTMDYLTPVEKRTSSFKEFVEEWVIDQYARMLEEHGMDRPWYWETFVEALGNYHHMVYASAYTYRATVWFDLAMPGPAERAWLRAKYPATWSDYEPIWDRIAERWRAADAGNEFAVHGTSIIGFCDLCQLVLSGGTPRKNTASTLEYEGKKFVFCSAPCRWIFQTEPQRYAAHKDVVKRVLAGEAPANLMAMLRSYFGGDLATWGKDTFGGDYPWLRRESR